MLLKSLEIQGFKTFPDKTVLKFEEPLVAVVGPNGSGKSNVSDAIRWVLGEQSTRVLRCAKMEDVVFKGTTARKAQGFAEVTMNIDNTDRRLNFDNDLVSITRRYYRSGESEYLINKASVRLKDINELFMDTGLGRDGYSMIGQGKIDSIVAAKSEDRREIFEEASGISRYRYRKEESERRLDRAEENLVRLRDILSELEDRVEPLRIQSEKAQKFIEYDKEKKGLEIGIWVETLNRSGKILREHEDKIAVSQNDYNETEQELELLATNIEENFTAINNCTLRAENIRNEAAILDEEAIKGEGEISVLKNDVLHNEQNIERIKSEIDLNNSSEKSIDDDILAKTNQIDEINSKIDGLNKQYISLADELEKTRKGTDTISVEIDNINIEIGKLSADAAEERIKYSSASSSVNEIKNRGNSIDTAITENGLWVKNLKEEKEELTLLLRSTDEKLSDLKNIVDGYSLRLSSRVKKSDEVKKELDKANLDAGEQQRRAKILEDLERNFEGFTQSVKVVMRESERGMISGVHGPVTKIISTPPEYAVAVETALGGAMQNIVVGTEQDAKNAINMLKKRDSGRATFLPLTTIKGMVIDKRDIEKMEGFVGVASELVKSEPQYVGIKNSLLGRTAVADNLNNAVNIAKRVNYRFRVVTLDGQVVNSGGSLTGGSLARNSGLLSRSAEIIRIKERAAEMLARAAKLSDEYKKITGEISNCQAEITTAESEYRNYSEEKIKVTSEYNRVIRDLDNAVAESKGLAEEKSSAQTRIDELTKEMLLTYDKINTAEQKKTECKDKLSTLTGTKQSGISACEEISEKMQEIKLSGFAAEKDSEALKNTVESLKMRKNDSAGLLSRLNTQIEESTNNIISLNIRIEKLTAETNELRKKSSELKASVEDVLGGRNSLEKISGELRQKERELSSKRENVGHDVARMQERKDNLQREYDTIITKLWDEYELTRREAEETAVEIEDLQKAQRRLTELKNKIKALGAVNVAAVVEYKEVAERYEFLKEQIGDVEKSRLELIKLISELTTQMQEQFAVRFTQINNNFAEIFKELFGGGNASLSFTDESNILNSGIEIKVHPPGKIVSHIEALSGGEKALVAISIYFAIMKVSPPPFCMLDEVEAALDDVNVRRFADYIHRMNDNTQFIVITHRRGTMEEADMLYGVTMQDDGVSKILALKTHEIEEKLGMKTN